MPTIAEVLKQSKFSDEKIASLDADILSALNGYVTNVEQTAQQSAAKAEADRKAAEQSVAAAKAAQEASELADRSWRDFRDNVYNPNITAWETERNTLAKQAADAAAEASFYKTQREAYLKSLNIDPANAPAFTPAAVDPNAQPNNPNGTRDAQGRFVPGPTGSPVFDPNAAIGRVGDGINMIQNIMWKYQKLYDGQPLPMSPSELIAKAGQFKLDPMEFAARTFKFAEKEEEQRQSAARAHDESVAKMEREKADAEWKTKLEDREKEFAAKERLHAERAANNPEQRIVVSSKIPELQRRVETKELPDPLLMNENQRRANTAKMIRDQIAANKEVAA